MNIKKLTDKQLAEKLRKLDRVKIDREETFYKYFQDLEEDIIKEIDHRNYKYLYWGFFYNGKKPDFWKNKAEWAKHCAKYVIEKDSNYFPSNNTYEIGTWEGKYGRPYLIDLVGRFY